MRTEIRLGRLGHVVPRALAVDRRSAARGLGGLGVVALLFFAAAEVLVRAVPELLPAMTRYALHQETLRDGGVRSLPHDELGYVWPAHDRGTFRAGDFAFSYTTDAHGFRNPGAWPETADVVVLGDSQAFGFGVGDDHGWVRRLAEAQPAAEIVNLGLIGAAPQQFLEVYRAYGAPLEPEVVLLALFPPNAIYAARLFDEWDEEGRPDRFDHRRAGVDRKPEAGGVVEGIKSVLRESHLLRGLNHALSDRLNAFETVTMSFEPDGRVQLIPWLFEKDAASARSRDRDFQRVVAILAEIEAEVAADGGEMVVVLFPTKEEVHLPLLGVPAPTLVAPFAETFEDRGIAHLDLTRRLRERAAAGEHLFFEIDLHPNPAGYQAIAEIVARNLEERLGDG